MKRLAIGVRLSWMIVAVVGGAHLQERNTNQLFSNLDEKAEESNRNLRAAIVQLRDVRLASCNLPPSQDCDLAALSNAELLLLDIEWKYTRAVRKSRCCFGASTENLSQPTGRPAPSHVALRWAALQLTA